MSDAEHTRVFSEDELNSRIKSEVSKYACWQAGRILGSMFSLQFGEKRMVKTRSGSKSFGAIGIQVRNVSWTVEKDCKSVMVSDQMDASCDSVLQDIFEGRSLIKIERGVDFSLVFSDGLVVRCDRSDSYESEGEAIFILGFTNRDIASFYSDGRIELSWMTAEGAQ